MYVLKKPVKKLFRNFFGVEGCVVVHPRITIIKKEEEIYYLSAVNSDPTITDLIFIRVTIYPAALPHNTNRDNNFFV